MAGRTNHKNLLQEIAQKMGVALPSYQNVNEGFAHAPKFRSTVHVDGVAYSSSETFVRVIDAEQHVSKVAYQCVFQKIFDEAHQFILQYPVHSKSTLMEYAVQVKSEAPTYTTRELKSKIRLFSSSVVFEGETYDGPVAKSKKEAEQSAAFVVIQSILGTTSGPRLAQVIKIKSKVFGGSNNVIGRKRPCPSTEEGGEKRSFYWMKQGGDAPDTKKF